jgi:hypothetical protein
VSAIADRVEALDWAALAAELDAAGRAVAGPLLERADCEALVSLYGEDERFRSTIVMARHGFGEGEYRYLDHPLPESVLALRSAFYPHLAEIANGWAERLRAPERFPTALDEFLAVCHGEGQTKPTPLILRYEEGGYNCLHQDLYGEVAFPFQVVVALSRLGEDYTGGEFLLLEQRPRAQSRGEAISLEQGQALVFPTRLRPVKGRRGDYRVNLRHGVSPLRSGRRFTLGVIFHDAR